MVAGDRIIVFSMHRSGSMLLYQLCRRLAPLTGYRHYSPNGGDVRVSIRQFAERPEHWLTQKGCFGPLRIYIPAPRTEDTKILLHLRDPRDVLVSMFFSYCYSHGGEIEGGTGYRKEVAEWGIDEFVWRMATAEDAPVTGDYGTGSHLWDLAGNVRRRYESYVANLFERPNTVFVRYEDMVSGSTCWLRGVSGIFGFEDPEQIERIRMGLARHTEADHDDQWVHRRQVTPGDYKRKLRPETIIRLNNAFGDVLARLGYPA